MFRDRWEELEKENLRNDVEEICNRHEYDKLYKETYENIDSQELERNIEEAVANAAPGEGEGDITEGEKAMVGHKARFVQITRTFFAPDLAAQHRAKMERLEKEKLRSGGGERVASAMGSHKDGSNRDDRSVSGGQYFPLVPEQWKEKVRDFKKLYVIKYPRIFQACFYFLKFRDRTFLCDRDTNKLNWKKCKSYINDDFFAKLGDYWPIGPKEDNYKEYEKLLFIQNNLNGISEEEVDEYSVALGKLFRWVKLALMVRIEDVKVRR